MDGRFFAHQLQEDHYGGVAGIDDEIDVEGAEEGVDGTAEGVEKTLETLDPCGGDVDAPDAGNERGMGFVVITPAIDRHLLAVIADQARGQFLHQGVEPPVIGGNSPGADDGHPEGGTGVLNGIL